MARKGLLACLLGVAWGQALPVRGDGGFFVIEGEVQSLAQTRQEVLLAIHGDPAGEGQEVTYVLRTQYDGNPNEFAWVIPVPATPSDVVAHETGRLFEALNEQTHPLFLVFTGRGSPGWGCACVGGTAGGSLEDTLVEVEASGQAGIFAWAALTSTGSEALLTWLEENGFNVPAEARGVLDGYIQQGMHFLALRINKPQEVAGNGPIEIPPIQFTCRTAQRVYPMAISQISAAAATEVLIYVLANHHAEAANVPNAVISPEAVALEPDSPSYSNYEALFAGKIAELGGLALITEFASSSFELDSVWSEAPAGALAATFLTRMRTVISPEQMTLDFAFQDAASDQEVSAQFWLGSSSRVQAALISGQPLGALLVFALLWSIMRRCSHRCGYRVHPSR